MVRLPRFPPASLYRALPNVVKCTRRLARRALIAGLPSNAAVTNCAWSAACVELTSMPVAMSRENGSSKASLALMQFFVCGHVYTVVQLGAFAGLQQPCVGSEHGSSGRRAGPGQQIGA